MMAKQTINLQLRSLKYSAEAPFTTDDVAEDGVAGHTAGNTFNNDPDNPNTGTFYMQTPSARGGAAIQLGMAEVPGSEYWEPWNGSDICETNTWQITAYSFTHYHQKGNCLDLTNPDWRTWGIDVDLSGGTLSGSCSAVAGNDPIVRFTLYNEGWPYIEATTLKIKLTASSSDPVGTNNDNWVYMSIYDSDSNNVVLVFAGGSNIWAGSNPVYVGDNGGAEQSIDLAALGLNGEIYYMYFIACAGTDPTTGNALTSFSMDHIDFNNDVVAVWEPWDGPGLCEDHDWRIISQSGAVTCPELPYTTDHAWGVGEIEFSGGDLRIAQYSIGHSCGTSKERIGLSRYEGSSGPVARYLHMNIACSAGSTHDLIQFGLSGSEGAWVSLQFRYYSGSSMVPGWDLRGVNGNIVVDLFDVGSSYSIISGATELQDFVQGEIIQSIGFTLDTCSGDTAEMVCGYIDFKHVP